MSGINGLFSEKKEMALQSIEEARERGTLEWVRPLLEAYRDRPEEDVRNEIGEMLGSLKISEAASVLSDALEDPEFESLRADIIRFLWSCGFQSEDDLRAVVSNAVDGDFACAMEALTWVEELERADDENILLDSILLVRGALDEEPGDERTPLFQAMLSVLQGLERDQ
jgi:hypothetical protein